MVREKRSEGDRKPQDGETRPGIVMRTVNKKLPPRQPTTEVVSLFALPPHRLSSIPAYTEKNSVKQSSLDFKNVIQDCKDPQTMQKC